MASYFQNAFATYLRWSGTKGTPVNDVSNPENDLDRGLAVPTFGKKLARGMTFRGVAGPEDSGESKWLFPSLDGLRSSLFPFPETGANVAARLGMFNGAVGGIILLPVFEGNRSVENEIGMGPIDSPRSSLNWP
jgi:hypothetical protein